MEIVSGVSFIMVCILHLMATLVSWIFMIVVSISCIFGTGLLWYTYYEIRHGLRELPSNMILIVIIFFTIEISDCSNIKLTLYYVLGVFEERNGIFVVFHHRHRDHCESNESNSNVDICVLILKIYLQVIILLLVFVMRKRVAFLAALFKETAKCLGSIPGLFIQPIVTFFFLFLFFMFWLSVIVNIFFDYNTF